jgi:hypothetical protein
MQAFEVLSFLWLAVLAAFVALMVYRGHLTQHETDELFLDDLADNSFRKQEHERIVSLVKRVHPYCKGVGGAAAALTVLMVGGQVIQVLPYVRF